MESNLAMSGKYIVQHIRGGAVIDEWEADNLVTNQGLDYALNAGFGQASAISTWYIGMFEGNYTPAASVTAATITGLSTECTAYASGTRPVWTTVTSNAQSLTNGASRASFVFNATKSIYGAFLVSSSTKSGTTGTLFSAARFTTAKAVDSGDELLVTYVLTAADA